MKHILLIISLILGATAVSAEPKAGEILQNGEILHMKVIDDGGLFPEEIIYHVASNGNYFECHYTDNANSEKLPEITCFSITSKVLIEKDTSALGQVEELIEKKLSEKSNQITDSELEIHTYKFPEKFSVYLKDSNAFLDFELEVSTKYHETIISHVERHQLQLRNKILNTVSKTTVEQLRQTNFLGDNVFEEKLLLSINENLTELEGFGGIENIFFPYFELIEDG